MRTKLICARQFLSVLLVILTGLTATAKTYYVSNAGNDNNNGLTTSTPWKTIDKVSSLTILVGGDAVLFNRGEVFYGQLILNNSGSSGKPITIGAYGTGADPVITGFVTVSAWTNLGSNIWESTNTIPALSAVNMVAINGVNTPMGRYPNTGYLTVNSHSTNTSITSSSLTGSPNWKGAEVITRKYHWTLDRNLITGQSGGTLTYKSATTDNAQDGYGFFIQNDSRTLDDAGEWYFNPSTKKLRVYSSVAPTAVKVATIDTLIGAETQNYITFDNLSIQGSNVAGFSLFGCKYITVQNCNIDFSGGTAILYRQVTYARIQNNTINHSNDNAIKLDTRSTNAYIGNNIIKNTGMIPGMGIAASRFTAIMAFGNNSTIEYNEIDSTGFIGINFLGNATIIRNNLVNVYCHTVDDGGGIYIFNSANTQYTGTKITNNILLYGTGAPDGTADKQSSGEGIYLDGNGNGIEISGNTIANCAFSGMFIHDSYNIQILNNTNYNNNYNQVYLRHDHLDPNSPLRNVTMKRNIFVSRATTQPVMLYSTMSDDINLLGTVDSNYYARPMDDNLTLQIDPEGKGSANRTNLTVAGWQAYTGFDKHSQKGPKTIKTLNDLRFEYNATTASKTIKLDGKYIDVKNVSYDGAITLAPYTSAVLIRNGTATNQLPTADAGTDKVITLPTSTVSLSGSATDPDGSISAYNWTKISGPTSGIITNINAASTTVTGLVQGTYQFQLKVTDNGGAIDVATVQVTVNSAGNTSPVAHAGGDQTITTTTATLNGSGTDGDGNIASYAWTKISGPAATIVSPGSASTSLTGLVDGSYQFQLKVTDNKGATAIDVILITVSTVDDLLPAVNPANTVNGLDYKYYEAGAGWLILPIFSDLLPVKTGIATNFDISLANRLITFSFNFTGYINVPADGHYTFYTTSDDGSNLYIDGVAVVDNNGLHGAIEESGTIGLQAGKHAISVGYFQQASGSVLTISYSGPGISKQVIPASALFRISNGLLPAVNPANTVNGLDYKYFESDGYSAVPDFSTLTSVKSGAVTNFDISAATSAIIYSFNFTGFIKVPSDGQYTFYTTSDDGSILYIDGVAVVNNDGLHGAIENSGTIGLQAGKHAISVGYFQQGGGSTLTVSYSGPGVSKQAVPASALYRISNGLLPAVNPANTVNGLDYDYYEGGTYAAVPDFSSITASKTGTSTNFDISLANSAITYSFNFTGFIKVPSDGQYTFYTTSDDGSMLYIDNVPVVKNDGLHGSAENSGTIGLQAGKHAISVGYFQQGGGSTLVVSYSGPGVSKQAIPASALYRISTTGNRVALNNNLSISSSTEAGVKAYPNPFGNNIEINITGGVAGEYKLVLTDVAGKVIWTKSDVKNAGTFRQSVNTSALQKGIYYLKVTQNNTISVIQLVK